MYLGRMSACNGVYSGVYSWLGCIAADLMCLQYFVCTFYTVILRTPQFHVERSTSNVGVLNSQQHPTLN